MAFGGKILTKTRKVVEGSHKQHSWHDSWLESIDIQYDGILTPEICETIMTAFRKSRHCRKSESLFGRLRASNGDSISHVDVENKQLILSCSESLCD